MMMKKGQLKIQQMAFMLIAVTLFFILAGMFVIVIKFSGLKQEANLLNEENAMLLATKLAESAEFSCGDSVDYGGSICIDADKVMVLKENMAKYSGFWGVENIEVRKIDGKETKVCDKGNYPNCNVIRTHNQEITGIPLKNFVILCGKNNFEGEVYDKCEVAKLLVSYNEIK